MSELQVKPVQPSPAFDFMYFLEICGESRIDGVLLDRLEAAWNDWRDRLHAYHLIPSTSGPDEGFLLIWLTEGVEDAVEQGWAEGEKNGMFFHNLAITLVMSAARSLVPELEENCTPLPRPGEEVLDFMERMDLEWNPQLGALNRQYAVYTPMPYRGGCEVCMQSHTCPNSKFGSQVPQ